MTARSRGNILLGSVPGVVLGERLARRVRRPSRARLRDARLGARGRVEGGVGPAGLRDHRASAPRARARVLAQPQPQRPCRGNKRPRARDGSDSCEINCLTGVHGLRSAADDPRDAVSIAPQAVTPRNDLARPSAAGGIRCGRLPCAAATALQADRFHGERQRRARSSMRSEGAELPRATRTSRSAGGHGEAGRRRDDRSDRGAGPARCSRRSRGGRFAGCDGRYRRSGTGRKHGAARSARRAGHHRRRRFGGRDRGAGSDGLAGRGRRHGSGRRPGDRRSGGRDRPGGPGRAAGTGGAGPGGTCRSRGRDRPGGPGLSEYGYVYNTGMQTVAVEAMSPSATTGPDRRHHAHAGHRCDHAR